MRDVWERIERNIGPQKRSKLAPGASPDEVAQLESRLGVALPEDVRASYAIHNGAGYEWILPGVELLSLEGIYGEWNTWRELLQGGGLDGFESKPQGPIKRDWWNLRWIPFSHDGGGNHCCIDLDPAANGVIGQVIDFDHDFGPRRVLAPSLRAYLEWFASELESGRIRFDSAGKMVFEKKTE